MFVMARVWFALRATPPPACSSSVGGAHLSCTRVQGMLLQPLGPCRHSHARPLTPALVLHCHFAQCSKSSKSVGEQRTRKFVARDQLMKVGRPVFAITPRRPHTIPPTQSTPSPRHPMRRVAARRSVGPSSRTPSACPPIPHPHAGVHVAAFSGRQSHSRTLAHTRGSHALPPPPSPTHTTPIHHFPRSNW